MFRWNQDEKGSVLFSSRSSLQKVIESGHVQEIYDGMPYLKFDSDHSSHKPNTRGVIIFWSGLLYFLVPLSHHTKKITNRRKCFPWKTIFLSLLFSQTYLPFYPSHLLSSASFFLCLGTKQRVGNPYFIILTSLAWGALNDLSCIIV